MKTITVTLDDDTARWAGIEAARRDMSLSSFLREMLRERMVGEAAYTEAMERYLSRPSKELGGAHPTREELHDRAGLR
jgi:hypothetical protein